MPSTISRWTPSPTLSREPFFRLFDTLFNQDQGEDIGNRTWTPPVDVRETPDAYVVSAELPGLAREDIQITLENNILRLSGERKFERDEKQENYHRIERSYGAFTRSFALPTQVDGERVQAGFKDGVLTVTVPKAEAARPRKIEIA
jgi:HSP20 family protein